MKSLKYYINNVVFSVFESGTVDGVAPIKGDDATKVANEMMRIIKDKFNIECAALGSVGKKRADQTSGDIDIALEYDWDDRANIQKHLQEAYEDDVIWKDAPSLHVLSFAHWYGEENPVQVDLMFVDNIDWAKFCYHSPSFINNESEFKGAWRTALLMGIVNTEKPENILGSKYKSSGNEFYKFTLNKSNGLKLQKKSVEGKDGKILKHPKTIDEIILYKDNNKLIYNFLGKEATESDCNSYETLLQFLSSDRYRFRSKERLEDIKKWLFDDYDLLRNFNDDIINKARELFNNTIESI